MQFSVDTVTVSTAQTITGDKTFLGTVSAAPGVIVSNNGEAVLRVTRTAAAASLDLFSNNGGSVHGIRSIDGNRWVSLRTNGGVLIGPAPASIVDVDASLVVQARSAAARALTARAAASQTADLFRAEDSGKAALLRISAAGALIHTQPQTLGTFTVATLPSAATAGQVAYASNGRTGVELAGAGTGCPVFSKGGQWLRFDTNTQVAA